MQLSCENVDNGSGHSLEIFFSRQSSHNLPLHVYLPPREGPGSNCESAGERADDKMGESGRSASTVESPAPEASICAAFLLVLMAEPFALTCGGALLAAAAEEEAGCCQKKECVISGPLGSPVGSRCLRSLGM